MRKVKNMVLFIVKKHVYLVIKLDDKERVRKSEKNQLEVFIVDMCHLFNSYNIWGFVI